MSYKASTWSSYNPHYSSLLAYQDKFGYTDRPLGKQTDPYMTSSGDKHFSIKDPEYWQRYRERRALGFPESAVTTPYYVGKFNRPGFQFYNHFDNYYPSYGSRYNPRSYSPYLSSYNYSYPYSSSYSSCYPYSSRSNYLWPYNHDYSSHYSYDLPTYTERLGTTHVTKHFPSAFKYSVDSEGPSLRSIRSSSLPPRIQALGPSVPVSQIHALDLEVLPTRVSSDLVRPRRLLQSLNIGADDLEWTAPRRRHHRRYLPW